MTREWREADRRVLVYADYEHEREALRREVRRLQAVERELRAKLALAVMDTEIAD